MQIIISPVVTEIQTRKLYELFATKVYFNVSDENITFSDTQLELLKQGVEYSSFLPILSGFLRCYSSLYSIVGVFSFNTVAVVLPISRCIQVPRFCIICD